MRGTNPTLLFLALLVLIPFDAGANTVFLVDDSDKKIHLNVFGVYVADAEPADTPEELLAQGIVFKPMNPDSHALTLGQQREPVWIRFTLKNSIDTQIDVVMEMSYASIDRWDIFIPNGAGFDQIKLGDHRPFSNREFMTGPYANTLTLGSQEEVTYYLRAQTLGQILLPVTLYTGNAYHRASNFRSAYYMLFAGVALGLFLFSLMLGLQTRDKIYIIYSGLVLMRMLQIIFSEGSVLILMENYPVLGKMSVIGVAALYTASALLFHTVFLRFDELYPRLNRFMLIIVGTCLFSGLVLPFINFTLAAMFVQYIAFIINPLIVISAIVRLLQGYKPALWYLGAVLLPVIVTTYGNVARMGMVNYFDTVTIWLGGAFSTSLILFSFALSARIRSSDLERIEAEKEAMRAKVEAKTKSDFLAQMSHEIRTPMNGVLGISELMAKTNLNETQQKYNRIIHSSGKLLLQVIDDVLDYSKIQAGKMTVEMIDFDPRELLDEVQEIFVHKFQQKNLCFEIHVDDEISEKLRGDPIRIRQVIFNLVNNAYKFTEKGSVMVSLSKSQESEHYKFIVQDTGEGISKSAQKNLFMPYYQVSKSTTRKYGGTGLGLSICKQLCELMGGEIGVKSELEKGSDFWFSLPLVAVCENEPGFEETSGDQNITEPAKSSRSLHVLVADDNPVNQIVAQGMLSTLGHTYQTVSNGREAVDLIKSKTANFDLVLMDCEMPELDGISATREIRAIPEGRSIPIIALTAHALEKQIENCKDAGMSMHLTKPLKLKDLQEVFRYY